LNSSRKFGGPFFLPQWKVAGLKFCVVVHKVIFCRGGGGGGYIAHHCDKKKFFHIFADRKNVLVCILRSNIEITKQFAKTFVMVYCTILAEVGKAFAENFSFLQNQVIRFTVC
jgi:hypothetical protein